MHADNGNGYHPRFPSLPRVAMRSILLRVVAILQIAGGLFGAVPLIEHALRGGSAFELAAILLGAALCVMAMVSGVLLLERGQGGVALAGWVQLLQVPVLATPWFSYDLQLGASAPLMLVFRQPLHVDISAHLPGWHWSLMLAGPDTLVVGANLVALALWLALRFAR